MTRYKSQDLDALAWKAFEKLPLDDQIALLARILCDTDAVTALGKQHWFQDWLVGHADFMPIIVKLSHAYKREQFEKVKP